MGRPKQKDNMTCKTDLESLRQLLCDTLGNFTQLTQGPVGLNAP